MTLFKNLRSLLIFGLVGTNLLVFALSAQSLYRSREQYEMRAQTLTQNISGALAQSISSSIEKIDLTVRTVTDELERELATDGVNTRALNAFLAREARQLPEIIALRVSNAEGLLIAGMEDEGGESVNLADRGYFIYHREHADAALRFSKPFFGRVTHKNIVTFTRRYDYPDGRFAGVIIAVTPVDYFTGLISRFDLGPRGTIILRDSDLGLITRYPPIPENPAGRIGNSEVSKTGRALSESLQTTVTYHTRAGSDGLERIYTLYRLPNAPLIIGAGVASADYLGDWKKEAYQTGALALGILFLSLMSGGLLLRQYNSERRHEQLQRQYEERLRAIMDNASAVIFLKDTQGRYLHVNKRYEDLFHVSNEQLQGKTDFDMFAHEVAQALTRNDQAVIQTGGPIEIEETVPHDDGLHAYISVKFPLRNAAGEIYAVCGISTDITERKKAEAERESLQAQLRDSNETYRAILATSHDGFWQVDDHGRLLDVNAAYCRQSGYTHDELIGLHISDLDAHESEADAIAHNRRIRENGSDQFEAVHRRKDGSLWDVEVSASYSPNQGGQYFGFVRDITERKRAERALKVSEERFRKAFYVSPDAININRLEDGRYVSINRGFTEITGYSEADTIGRTSTELNIWDNPRDRERLVAVLKQEGSVANLDAPFRAKDGSIRYGLMSAAVIDVDGVPHVISVTRDMTERRKFEEAKARLEAQLRESQKMEALGTLAGGIAHDFNNIIAAILGNSELALQDAQAGQPVLRSLEEIHKASVRAKNLVEQILSFSRRQTMERSVISLAPVVEESVRLLRAGLPAGVSLSAHCAPDTPLVLADATQIEQVLLNLSTNAWQAAQGQTRPGLVEVQLDLRECKAEQTKDDGYVLVLGKAGLGRCACLTVQDNGAGMPEGILTRIFEPFFTTKPVGKGTGLGLAVVHGILQEHGASVEVRSVLGEGSTFRICFPEAQTAPAQSDVQAASSAPAHGAGRHVLYVDDDESIVLLMTRLLERQGYKVSGYTDAALALEAARAQPHAFDLAVTDYNMPGMSGIDVARVLKAIRPDLPVALASGYITEELRQQAPVAGVSELIYKPNTITELCETVARLAQKAKPRSNAS